MVKKYCFLFSENIKEEKKLIESEKKSFDENMQMNVEKQREKLQEIIVSELSTNKLSLQYYQNIIRDSRFIQFLFSNIT